MAGIREGLDALSPKPIWLAKSVNVVHRLISLDIIKDQNHDESYV